MVRKGHVALTVDVGFAAVDVEELRAWAAEASRMFKRTGRMLTMTLSHGRWLTYCRPLFGRSHAMEQHAWRWRLLRGWNPAREFRTPQSRTVRNRSQVRCRQGDYRDWGYVTPKTPAWVRPSSQRVLKFGEIFRGSRHVKHQLSSLNHRQSRQACRRTALICVELLMAQ